MKTYRRILVPLAADGQSDILLQRAGISPPKFRVHVLEIGQIYVNDPFQRPEGFRLVVPVCIIYCNRMQPSLIQSSDYCLYLWNNMRWRNKSNSVYSLR